MCSIVADSLQHHELSSPPDSSVEFSRQEYWSGLPCPSPGDLPDSGIEPEFPVFPALPVDCLPLSYQGSPVLQDALPW